MAEKPDKPMTIQEVADYLRYSPNTIRRLARNGHLPGRRVGSEWRFDRRRILSLCNSSCGA